MQQSIQNYFHSVDNYYGNIGAVRCLLENRADVALVDSSAIDS